MNKVFTADISAIESSDIYMTIKTVMFKANEPNLNNVRVSNDFISEIVMNQDKYIGIPLVCDLEALSERDKLTHLYNPDDDTFGTNIIGSFYKFEIDNSRENAALIGYARVSKRDMEVCSELMRLYEMGALKFSFEISCGKYIEEPDGTIMIDADNSNKLTALAVVSCPACEDAVALNLVAEANVAVVAANEQNKKETQEDNHMPNVEPEIKRPDENLPIEPIEDFVKANVPQIGTEKLEENAENGTEANEENNVAETVEEEKDVNASEEDNVSVESPAEPEAENAETETAGCEPEAKDEEPEEEKPEEAEDAECEKKHAEETAELKAVIAELERKLAELTTKIEAHDTAIAEVKSMKVNANAINPFMAEVEPEHKKKYSRLFENAETEHTGEWTIFAQ